jgi:hypothetical protein
LALAISRDDRRAPKAWHPMMDLSEPPVGHDAATLDPAHQLQSLEDLIASIRASVAPGVATDVRAAGTSTRQAILSALTTRFGQSPTAASAAAASPASVLRRLAAMSHEQLIELLKQLPGGRP